MIRVSVIKGTYTKDSPGDHDQFAQWSQHGEKMNFTFVTSKLDPAFLRAKIKL